MKKHILSLVVTLMVTLIWTQGNVLAMSLEDDEYFWLIELSGESRNDPHTLYDENELETDSESGDTFLSEPYDQGETKSFTVIENCYIELFDGNQFNGNSLKVYGPGEFRDLSDLSNSDGIDWTNEADSFKVGSFTTVIVWTETNFKGKPTVYKAGDYPSEDEPLSMKIVCGDDGDDGYVYENGVWTPEDPSGVSTDSDDINVIESSTANLSADTDTTDNRLTSANMLTVQLFTTENFNKGGPTHDSFGIIFGDGLDNEITNADAKKPMNFYENLGIDHNGTYLSLERREMPQPAEVYPLYSDGYSHTDYTLKMIIDGLEEIDLYLDDHFTGTSTLLEGGDTIYTFSVDANDKLSTATDRFSIRIGERLGVDNKKLLEDVLLFPNLLDDNTFSINAPRLNGEQILVSLRDLRGRQIFEDMLDCRDNKITVSVNENLPSGVYLVTLKHDGEESTYILVKK